MTTNTFKYADLFAGVGGFAATLSAMGGEHAYAVEIDPAAAAVYTRNWGHNPLGDVTKDATETVMRVPEHDILVGGFPCQPFSKSGAQRGMDETRGTLFFNIMQIVRLRRPTVVVLENVRNLVGPRHTHEWAVIIEQLRAAGYQVSDRPAIVSPHQIAPSHGGAPPGEGASLHHGHARAGRPGWRRSREPHRSASTRPQGGRLGPRA